MSKHENSILFMFAGLLIILIVGQLFPSIAATQLNTGKDGFTVSPGEYPKHVEDPLLFPEYKKKSVNYGVVFRENDSANNSRLYPVAPHGYQQSTNNVKHWVTPDNGSCSPASFCGALYEPSQEVANASDGSVEPMPLPFSTPNKRVGYYAALS